MDADFPMTVLRLGAGTLPDRGTSYNPTWSLSDSKFSSERYIEEKFACGDEQSVTAYQQRHVGNRGYGVAGCSTPTRVLFAATLRVLRHEDRRAFVLLARDEVHPTLMEAVLGETD